ncbi:cellulose biosynthesis protein BcsN [Methylobacterium radiodurans]|uniref:cellulose biosynthesis protein BcsN n=1 Tax=Methylobacterium radiodurans TaxID=2202828 RepID=UPI001FE353A6|nr:cellulose biosynthesis protein BcsN [Methylobacterium radiodurans]
MRPGLRALVLPVVLALSAARPAAAQPAPALRLPGAGPVEAVIETRLRDGFDQRIRYAGGDGRNHAEIALRNETGDLLLAFPPRLAKPSQFGIEGEIAVRFPGQVLRVQTVPRRNAYGPVGLALGTDCLYAWQWFERPANGTQVAGGGLFGPLSAAATGRRALSLRIRLCRTAEASLADLVVAVERMTIALPGTAGLAGPGPAARPPAAVRRARPKPAAPRAARPAPSEPEARPRPEPRQASPAPPPTARQQPPPLVPPPPQATPGDAGRRYLAPTAPETPVPTAQPAPAPAAPGAQRYITEPPRSPEMPSPAPGRGTGESLSRDLPSEAYRPPPERGGR